MGEWMGEMVKFCSFLDVLLMMDDDSKPKKAPTPAQSESEALITHPINRHTHTNRLRSWSGARTWGPRAASRTLSACSSSPSPTTHASYGGCAVVCVFMGCGLV